jgi:hypothetical protein
VPAAVLSFFFPGIGLLLLGRSELKALGVKIFVGYLVLTVALPVAVGVVGSVVGMYGLWSIWQLAYLARLIIHPLAMIHTHDATVKIAPQLGQPLVFKS